MVADQKLSILNLVQSDSLLAYISDFFNYWQKGLNFHILPRQQVILAKYLTMNIKLKESWNIDKTDVVDGNMNAGDAISNRSVGA